MADFKNIFLNIAKRAAHNPRYQQAGVDAISELLDQVAQNAHNPELVKKLVSAGKQVAPVIIAGIATGTKAEAEVADPKLVEQAKAGRDENPGGAG